MKKLTIVKITTEVIFLASIFFFLSKALASEQKTNNWLDEPVNIKFQNEPLSKVLNQISEQTGVAIAYDQRYQDEKVSGYYQNVKTSDAIARLFRDKNKTIHFDKAKKIIIVKTFGAKSFVWAGITHEATQKRHGSDSMTLAELEKMHAQQYKEYKELIDDDNEMLEDEGMTRGELRAMQEKHYKDYQNRVSNDNEMLEDEGMTRGELRAMQEEHYKDYQNRVSNDNEMLEDEGMTRGELRAMQEKHFKGYKNRVSNDNEMLEDEGMTRGELRAMQKKQYREYQIQQSNPKRLINATIY